MPSGEDVRHQKIPSERSKRLGLGRLFRILGPCAWSCGALFAQPALPPVPAADSQEASKIPWQSLDAFITKQIDPASDPDMVARLKDLHQDSSRFRPVLEAIWLEQPKIRLTLLAITDLDPALKPKKNESASFGMLFVKPSSSGYELVVAVQTELVKQGQDSAEPWLGQILYALLELSRNDSVEEKGKRFLMTKKLQRKMWDFQRQIRSELKAGQPEKYAKTAYDGEYLYKMKLLWSLK
jgi:hypothetical protein